jgi:phosphomannomutase
VREFLKVGVSGVRGVVGESFTPQVAASFARAFASFVEQGAVVVGRDTRPSGYAAERAVVAGLQSAGCAPLVAGIVPTPTLCMLVPELGARGGIAITASHNPAPWNALKFVGREGRFLTLQRAGELYDIYHQGDFGLVAEDRLHEEAEVPDPMSAHRRKVFAYVDVEAIRARRFRVAADCCNGVGALHTRRFLEELGCEVTACFEDPSGSFGREPEPLPENLDALRALVREKRCDVGFAQDPDGDRLAIVDERGEAIGEDLTVALAVRQVLDGHRKGPVAINLATSRCVQRVAEERGCPVLLTRIGEINVVETMLAAGAVAGGEGNGGVVIPDIHPCRDSFAGMAVVLELMAATGRTISSLRADIPRYVLVKDKMEVQGGEVATILRSLRRKYERLGPNLLDGVHVTLEDSWFHVRPSNTEPVLRLVAEAPTAEEARALVRSLRDEIEKVRS